MYLALMHMRTTQNEFPVDFDQLWKSLGYTDKANAKRVLTTFVKGVDYITQNDDRLVVTNDDQSHSINSQLSGHSRGGHNKIAIFL